MTATDPTERALRLLSLLQTHRFWPGEELTARLGVSARTLRRDVDRLRSLGYPVDATPGTAGGYRLAAGAHLPPLLLDDDEAVAIAVGLRSAASASIDGMEDTALPGAGEARAGAARPVAPAGARGAHQRRVAAVVDDGPTVDADALAVLALACRDHEQVRFDYRRRDGDDASRLVEPYQLVSTGRRWYLVAWDVRRDDWRTFRLDRLERASARGRAVRAARAARRRRGRVRGPVDPVDAATGVDAAGGRCRRRHPARRAPLGRRASSSRSDAGGCRVRIEGSSDDALLRVVTWLAGRHPVTVVEPDSVATLVRDLRSRLA